MIMNYSISISEATRKQPALEVVLIYIETFSSCDMTLTFELDLYGTKMNQYVKCLDLFLHLYLTGWTQLRVV